METKYKVRVFFLCFTILNALLYLTIGFISKEANPFEWGEFYRFLFSGLGLWAFPTICFLLVYDIKSK